MMKSVLSLLEKLFHNNIMKFISYMIIRQDGVLKLKILLRLKNLKI